MIEGVAIHGGAQIYDRNGRLLFRFADPAGGIRIPVSLSAVSPYLVSATISTEDASFWTGPGVNLKGTVAAAADNLREYGNPLAGRGGSGITQQLVKQTLLDPERRTERSAQRKLTEAIYAIEITRRYSKEDILEWYLNLVNYGGVYNGIESAAQGYFGVHARDLTLAQAALLAGIPQSPAEYSPHVNPATAKQRQIQVLDLMVRHGAVTLEAAEAAKTEALTYVPLDVALPLRAPWFVEQVKQDLIAKFGEKCFETCGLTVLTTLDIDLQDRAQQILDHNLSQHGDRVGAHNGALLSIDARTGEVLVMLGSRDYNNEDPVIQGRNNFATSILQPGSAFKPFVYLALFMRHGYGPSSTIWDAPFSTADGYHCENPRILGVGRSFGPIPIRLALGSSLNCAANRAAATAGVQDVIHTAETMGITTLGDPSQYGPAIATGGANINLLDMTYAYTTLARNGQMIGEDKLAGEHTTRALDPAIILKVINHRGEVLYQYEPRTHQVVPPGYAYLITNILSDCQNRRLIWSCAFPAFTLADGRPVAVKTGTQQGATRTLETAANWQFMYTPQVVTGGWVGNGDGSTWTDVSGGANAVGLSVQQLEQLIIDTYEVPAADFERPPDVLAVQVRVPDASLGLLLGCGPIELGLFVRGTEPDVNNRVCAFGSVRVPSEQLGTGGLPPYVPPPLVPDRTSTATPARPEPAAPEPAAPGREDAPGSGTCARLKESAGTIDALKEIYERLCLQAQ
jgi:membrane peptidoglycan carboxypeptidase